MSERAKKGKFVWPPKSPASPAVGRPDQVVLPRESDLDSVSKHAQSGATEFVVPSIATGSPSYPELEPRHSWWRAIEEAWFGLVTPSFAHRAWDAGWAPDSNDAYCWRCGHPTGPHESNVNIERGRPCSNCRGTKPRFSRVVRLGPFEGLLRDAIHEVKFTAWRQLGTELGRLLGRQLGAALDAARVPRERVVLVPMPTTTRRRLVRGIDHTTVLARGVRDVLGTPILQAVTREHRPSQTQVPQSQRRDNVSRTMRLKGGVEVFGRLVVVIDDVMTTGSTMGECARAIREGSRGEQTAPFDVWAGVLAVAAEGATKRPAKAPGERGEQVRDEGAVQG